MRCLLSTKQCLISTFLSSLNVCRGLRGRSSFMRLCSVTAKMSQAIFPWQCRGEKKNCKPLLTMHGLWRIWLRRIRALISMYHPVWWSWKVCSFPCGHPKGWINKAKHKEVMRKKIPKQKPNKASGNNSLKKTPCSMGMLRVMTLLQEDKEFERNRPWLRHGCIQLAPALRGPSRLGLCSHTPCSQAGSALGQHWSNLAIKTNKKTSAPSRWVLWADGEKAAAPVHH